MEIVPLTQRDDQERTKSRNGKREMNIYLRHGEDDLSDEATKHDGHLTREGKKQVKNTAKYLLKKYGIPSTIYCSPFVRTTETAEQMKKFMHSTGIDIRSIRIVKDERIGKY